MGYALFVVGPAGSGKSTFCRNLVEHGAGVGRTFKLINLDPANIDDKTFYALDIRDHITLDEVQEGTGLGPNGGLMLALEELSENIQDFELEDVCSDYVVFDCPGQLELFTHSEAISTIVDHVKSYSVAAMVYLMEATFLLDPHKYIHGCLTSVLAMARFELPHMNIITKVDLVESDEDLDVLQSGMKDRLGADSPYRKLSLKIHDFLDENGALLFKPLDWNNEECVFTILYEIDSLVGYWDDAEPRGMRE